MNRTYSDLKRGGVLAVGDTLLLHGYQHDVRKGSAETYWLNNSSLANCAVFEKFDKDRYDWAKEFGSTCSGSFPEFRSLQELTKFVISIYEEPEFKKGDYVTINERYLTATDYPASFVDDMVKLSGKTFLVQDFCTTVAGEERKAYNGDPHWYYLETPRYGCWTWHSSMFRKATESEIEAYKKSNGESKVDYKSGVIKVDAGLDVSKACQGSGSASSIASSLEDSRATLDRMMETIRSFKPYSPDETVDLRDSKLRLPKDINKTPHINL